VQLRVKPCGHLQSCTFGNDGLLSNVLTLIGGFPPQKAIGNNLLPGDKFETSILFSREMQPVFAVFLMLVGQAGALPIEHKAN